MSTAYILVVDDEPDIGVLVKDILVDEGYEVHVVHNGEQAREARLERRPDLLLLDIWLPDVDGISLLKEWQEGGGLPCPVVMMSGHGTVESAVEATRLGAYDYLEKPLSMAKLLLTVERALQADRLTRENIGLRKHVMPHYEPIGKSAVMAELRSRLERIAQHDAPVLLIGEAGTGKETYARYMHQHSARKDGPFVSAGAASIARENSAVELFGSEEEGRVYHGLLEQANGGVLFLDEVGDMDLETQGRLQSALETALFLRIGGSHQVRVDVRIIAATRRNLEEAVRAGDFRDDLYYLLNVVPVQLPSLREHSEDVPDLLTYFVDLFVNEEKLDYRHFTIAAQNFLRNYHWPGNVRELKNLVQRLLILGQGEEISTQEAASAVGSGAPGSGDVVQGMVMPMELPLREAREQFERMYFLQKLRECEGSVGRVAKEVGMERTHVYRKLRALGIDPKELDQG